MQIDIKRRYERLTERRRKNLDLRILYCKCGVVWDGVAARHAFLAELRGR